MKPIRPLTALMLATALTTLPLVPLAQAQTPLVQMQSLAPLVEAVKPAVVTVRTVGGTNRRTRAVPNEMEEFMERFFDQRRGFPQFPEPRTRPQQGVGSGFIIDAEGIVVTNNHVVQDADEITVILDDGTEAEAELIGRDTRIDIAVLRIDVDRALPTVTWGPSDAVKVGDWAIAIGNPLGLDGTVTAGIVSARGRDIRSGPYDDYIQVDAAINRGNSGGPLFDVTGRVIGVNTAIISPSGGNIGLGFAIPSEQAQSIVADLLDDGTVERGWIGVAIQPVDRDIADSLGLADPGGALVSDVTPDSPAQAAGLQPGDVILGFNDTPIKDLRDLTRAVAAAPLGSDARIEIWRKDAALSLDIQPALLESASAEEPTPVLPAGLAEIPELGLTLEATGADVIIAEATDAAADSGLQSGDRLLSVNQTQITGAEAVRNAVSESQAADRESVLLLIEREGARRFVTVALSAA